MSVSALDILCSDRKALLSIGLIKHLTETDVHLFPIFQIQYQYAKNGSRMLKRSPSSSAPTMIKEVPKNGGSSPSVSNN